MNDMKDGTKGVLKAKGKPAAQGCYDGCCINTS